MVGWYHQLNGHEFEQAPGDSEGKGSLACCSPVQFSSVAQSCLTLCDPMDHSTPGLPVHHQLPDFTQTHVHEFQLLFPYLHTGLSRGRSGGLVFPSLSEFSAVY